MRARLLPLLIVLMAGVLLALGLPLGAGLANVQQQRLVVDRIDDTARFAALAQYVATRPFETPADVDERLITLRAELNRYEDLYGIHAGVFNRNGSAMAAAPLGWEGPPDAEGRRAFQEALAGRRSHDPEQVWPWEHRRLTVASPVIRDGDVVAVVVTDSPTGAMRSWILHKWLLILAGESAAMLLAVAAAFRLTGWVLRPVRTLDAAAHNMATGHLNSRVVADQGPPELRRLARSFNEMADNVEESLEQQRAFVADASHQLRNPLAALLLRIELLALELPDGHEEIASVRTEGKRLARVLDDLLDLALAEHAASDLQLTDVAELVTDRVGAWSPVAEREGVALAYTGPAAATGWADPVALSSALDAVVDNALKFTPEGARVEVALEAAGDRVVVTVTDEGPGLTDEELTRVGDRFWRSGRHQNVSGSGLGLSIARTLLTAGGAGIAYGRNEPHGLRVVIDVPRERS
ncbi:MULTISPECIES: sensor histidine kinase [Streptomyces]|uniref:sensor histidine kinase n=1 Tax=Streptomyces TaxID=1883 RepID=UPI00163BCFE8|nr:MULTISPECIES: HAMP domain-containing sensor histidine kinase [Streptomyces]MBC2876806.1 HAMP domain-containing histidine kinase [Streptomyces sp. TYQ1024]UBI36429.1 HAMP domain-containing histidine kinase [Streptomyces mobaraensis]UKW29021.1 HAMP domain-containing histidine kinase [Streptomyces sp. TYQ1024]